ncbi:MAG: eCIS core domain-containing protein, partial [Anaerolineales bacterium]
MSETTRKLLQTQVTHPASVLHNTDVLQRACACGQHSRAGGECESRKKQRSELQRSPLSRQTRGGEDGGQFAPPIVQDVIRSPGQPLDGETRQSMESRFEHDFSGVRVHADAGASESAQAIDARAYTIGKDVVFGAAEYNPHTSAGQSLIAH